MRAGPGALGGRYTAAPAPRPAASRPRAALAPLPGAASPARRLSLCLGPPGRQQVCHRPLRPAAAPLLSRLCSWRKEQGTQGVARECGRLGPKGRPIPTPIGQLARAAAVPALLAGRRPAPPPRSSGAARFPLALRRTQTLPSAACGSDRRRRSCCGRRKDKQQPGSRRSSPAPSHLGVRSRKQGGGTSAHSNKNQTLVMGCNLTGLSGE